jgi:hypothetical protein
MNDKGRLRVGFPEFPSMSKLYIFPGMRRAAFLEPVLSL